MLERNSMVASVTRANIGEIMQAFGEEQEQLHSICGRSMT
jgi:hypothetical protein